MNNRNNIQGETKHFSCYVVSNTFKKKTKHRFVISLNMFSEFLSHDAIGSSLK